MYKLIKYAMVENIFTLAISGATIVLCNSSWGLLGLLFLINLNSWDKIKFREIIKNPKNE